MSEGHGLYGATKGPEGLWVPLLEVSNNYKLQMYMGTLAPVS